MVDREAIAQMAIEKINLERQRILELLEMCRDEQDPDGRKVDVPLKLAHSALASAEIDLERFRFQEVRKGRESVPKE